MEYVRSQGIAQGGRDAGLREGEVPGRVYVQGPALAMVPGPGVGWRAGCAQVGPTLGVDEAARLMATRKISALPVTEGDRLVGIVTETDVLQLFVRAMGVLEPSSRVDVILSDQTVEAGLRKVVEEVWPASSDSPSS
jgi:hypothetical protein